MMTVLTVAALTIAGAPLYFFVFWTWFAFWRRHQVLTYLVMFGTLGGCATVATVFREELLAPALAMPVAVQVIGWVLVVIANGFGLVADRQLGIRVRSFTPFFEERGRIDLITTGAYGVVRHPIYAAGIWYQLGIFLITGSIAVAAACVILALGAVWFTRQEERRLVALLKDPGAYDRYRARVPALFPLVR